MSSGITKWTRYWIASQCFIFFLAEAVNITEQNVLFNDWCRFEVDTQTYTCQNESGITEIQPFALSGMNITTLRIRNNNILALQKDAFCNKYDGPGHSTEEKKCTDSTLQTLDLEGNMIRRIDKDAFCGTAISHLYLSNNKLEKIPNVTCIGGTLMVLHLQGNAIAQLNTSDMHALRALEDLNVTNNILQSIGYNAFCKTALKTVDLSYNNLKSTPNFSCISHGIRVSMYSNAINELPPDSFENVEVDTELHLGKNCLANVTSLEHLNWSDADVNLDSNNLTCFDVVSIKHSFPIVIPSYKQRTVVPPICPQTVTTLERWRLMRVRSIYSDSSNEKDLLPYYRGCPLLRVATETGTTVLLYRT